MAISTFKRYEKKFLINTTQLNELLPLFLTHMDLDEYCKKNENGKYTIYNIYYDTPNSDVARECSNTRSYKEKLRLRSYVPVTDPQDMVFVELKKKESGVGNKRRIKIPYQQAVELIEHGVYPQLAADAYLPNQVAKEIVQYLQFYPVRPTVYLQYDRIALFGKDNPEFRLTIDDNIRARRTHFDFGARADDTLLLTAGTYILEVKFLGAMPMWMARKFSEMGLFSRGFSKYGTDYKLHAQARTLPYTFQNITKEV